MKKLLLLLLCVPLMFSCGESEKDTKIQELEKKIEELEEKFKIITNDYNTDYHKFSKRLSVMEENNTKLVIDPLSEMYLIGTTIDYINEDFEKGVFENKFIFLADKNMATSCGCGTSFTPKN